MSVAEEINVVVVVVLGQETDNSGLKSGPNTMKRIDKGIQTVYNARHKGEDAFLLFAAGKNPKGWKSPHTFATIMANYAEEKDLEIEPMVNESEDNVWTSWPEIDYAVEEAKYIYKKTYMTQMTASWNDYSRLKIIFVSDKKHLRRIRLMARYKLRHSGRVPPTDKGFTPDLVHRVRCTEPFCDTVEADHSLTAWWYEPLAIGKFYCNVMIGRIRR